MGFTDFDHHMAFVNGQQIHYVRAGEGPAVVLLHGWPQTWYMWRKVIPTLSERYTVIAPDLRGFGQSSKPLDGYDKRTVAVDIRELVRSLGFEDVALVGHDMGGPTAYAYACAHPDEVRRLAILDVAITIDEADCPEPERLGELYLDELDEQDELHIAKDANAREGGTGARGLVVLLLTRDGSLASHQLTVDIISWQTSQCSSLVLRIVMRRRRAPPLG